MAGGSGEHSLIISNLNREVGNKLKGKPCRVYDSNLRVGPGHGPFTCYPDATIICGDRIADPRDKSRQTFTNPTAVFEVLSPSTMDHDLGDKFKHLRDIASLREYVIVRQDYVEVSTYLRHDDGSWKLAFHTDPAGRVPLASVGIELSMAEIYDGVTFPIADPQP
jgi:Uma2 family endonuclease